jgi:hypothetical protein
MNCDEFAIEGPDLGEPGSDLPSQQEAREHLRTCAQCAGLYENWQTLRGGLRELGWETRGQETPSRVEMRLRQEFRTQHKTLHRRRVAMIAGWALAAAALLLGTFSWMNWKHDRNVARNGENAVQVGSGNLSAANYGSQVAASGPEMGETLMAANDSGEFTLLPGTMPGTLDQSMVVRVEMQRRVLGSLGLTVNEDRAADWIQVDLLVGDDGQPQAVRLPQSAE